MYVQGLSNAISHAPRTLPMSHVPMHGEPSGCTRTDRRVSDESKNYHPIEERRTQNPTPTLSRPRPPGVAPAPVCQNFNPLKFSKACALKFAALKIAATVKFMMLRGES